MAVHDITVYGAVGDGVTDNSAAIAAAVEACSAGGGGTVYVPAGDFLTGPVELKSFMTLYLEAGALLRFTPEFAAYPPTETRWSGYECWGYKPLLFGRGLQQVAVKGEGIIDGQGEAWWEAYRSIRRGDSFESPYGAELAERNRKLTEEIRSNIVEWKTQFLRPPLLQLLDCEQVVLEGITLRNSPFWNTHLVYCNHVNIRSVTFQNPDTTPNGDGLDVDSCADVRISDCHFDVGDDCLCLKSGIDEDGRRVGKPTENVTVTGCTMLRGHGGVVLGSETAGGIRNVVISNCIFIGTDRGIRIKTNRARGGGVENVLINGIYMEDVLCPLAVNAFYKHGIDESNALLTDPGIVPVTEGTPVIRHLRISNVTAKNARAAAAFLYGLPEMPIEDVVLSGMTFEMTLDPAETGGEPDMVREERIMAGDGILCRHVRDLELNDVRVETRQGPALRLEYSEEIRVSRLRMKNRHEDSPVVQVEACSDVVVQGLQPGSADTADAIRKLA